MKNKFVNLMTKLLVIIIIIIIAVFAFFIYSNAKEDNSQTNKIEEEIVYLDTKITNLINHINGIHLQNYKIVISKIEESEGETNSDTTQEKNNKQEGGNEEEESKQQIKISKMEKEVTVNNSNQVNWEWIQGETEVFYSVWATIVLDLYEIGISSEKILGFSNTLDQTLINVKNKDKVKTCESFAKLYEFLPQFANTSHTDEFKKNLLQTKSYIINSYAYVESEAWDKVQVEVNNAEKNFMQVVNNINNNEGQKKFNINKTYILIEELKNSLSIKDTGIFYIKYKNLLEELNSLL